MVDGLAIRSSRSTNRYDCKSTIYVRLARRHQGGRPAIDRDRQRVADACDDRDSSSSRHCRVLLRAGSDGVGARRGVAIHTGNRIDSARAGGPGDIGTEIATPVDDRAASRLLAALNRRRRTRCNHRSHRSRCLDGDYGRTCLGAVLGRGSSDRHLGGEWNGLSGKYAACWSDGSVAAGGPGNYRTEIPGTGN